MDINLLSHDDLIKLLRLYAKNWLAHDGCWFLAAEEKLGMDVAIELDTRAWACFAPIEARRIMEAFDIPHHGALDALARVIALRMYAMINRQETERIDDDRMRFRMLECRVQHARQRKGLPLFPCKSVGLVEFTEFARAVDARIETRCIHAPPDDVTDSYCEWEFRLGR